VLGYYLDSLPSHTIRCGAELRRFAYGPSSSAFGDDMAVPTCSAESIKVWSTQTHLCLGTCKLRDRGYCLSMFFRIRPRGKAPGGGKQGVHYKGESGLRPSRFRVYLYTPILHIHMYHTAAYTCTHIPQHTHHITPIMTVTLSPPHGLQCNMYYTVLWNILWPIVLFADWTQNETLLSEQSLNFVQHLSRCLLTPHPPEALSTLVITQHTSPLPSSIFHLLFTSALRLCLRRVVYSR
jgi:hypothetical protein